MKRIVCLFALCALSVCGFGQAGFTPNPVAAYINGGSGWNPWSAAAGFGALGFTPPPVALYCQASLGAPWTPCTGSGSGGGTTTIASGTAALGTSAIASGACATVVTATATGVASTDAIIWNPNASIKAVTGYVPSTAGGLTIAAYPTANAVNFDVCNWSAASITPGAVTLNFRVVR